jgi:hypothetical protein
MFKRATKSQIKIRLAFSGPAGSGKTYSALSVASHLSNKIGLIDTERGSASRYADVFSFDTCELNEHHPAKYIEAIKSAESAGYEVVIIDSLSHAWYAELELVGNNRGGGANFDGWKNVRPWERKLLDTIIGSRSHIIATMRSKTEWDTTQRDSNGKMKPVKIGTTPVQTQSIDYEFDLAGELSYDHTFYISKSRCSELQNTSWLKPGEELAEVLKRWMGNTPIVSPDNDPNNYRVKQIRTLLGIDTKSVINWLRFEKFVETPANLSKEEVEELIVWMAVQWSIRQGINDVDSVSSWFVKYVSNMVSEGYEEVEAIRQWMMQTTVK